MNILTECCLTHCILHHHYLVNKSVLLVFRTARYCRVSFYLEMNRDFNKGFLTESFLNDVLPQAFCTLLFLTIYDVYGVVLCINLLY